MIKPRRLYFLCAVLALFGRAQGQVSFGHAEKIDSDWRFLRVDSTISQFESPKMKDADFDDRNWQRRNLPHDWSVEQPMSPDKGSCQAYLTGGIGWYRKDINIDNKSAESKDKRYYVYFEGAYNYSEVYINGKLLGIRPSGFASFLYDITPYLSNTGKNLLAVRVNHSQEFDSRWYTGSGINRHVWLITAPEVHLAQWGTAYRLVSINSKSAVIEVDVETTDERADKSKPLNQNVVIELADAIGTTVATAKTTIGAQEKKTVKLTIKNPQRWTLDNPYLYTLTTKLPNDQSVVKAGLRTLEFSANKGFALNGKWMKIKGVCMHDDAGVLGTAVPKAVWERRIKELKAIGVNAIRMSHNPHAPEVYELCDELGMLVMDEASDEWEFPKRKWMRGWNKGKPEYQGTYTYFNEWIDRDVADMVRRDRCHPSIFMWSIGNEVDYPNDPYSHPVLDGGTNGFTQPMYGGYHPNQPNAERIGHIAKRLAKIVKDIDPSRPTTGALAGVVMSNETLYPSVIDVVGYNYTESRYAEDHKTYPKRIIYGSENRHDLNAWKAVTDNEHIFGQFLWTGTDYLGEAGQWPSRGMTTGLLDMAGQRKPLGWYRASLWSEKPTCYIGTSFLPRRQRRGNDNRCSPYALDTWNYREGQTVRVMCYTNASSAKLFLNDKQVGGEPRLDKESNILFWDIDYEPGTLRCEADNGASYEIKTFKAPYALRVSTDSLAHIFVEVVDEDGNRVKNADNEIAIQVTGAELLGLENGNPNDTSISGKRRNNFMTLRAFEGRLIGYFQKESNKDSVSIRVSSPWLKPVVISL